MHGRHHGFVATDIRKEWSSHRHYIGPCKKSLSTVSFSSEAFSVLTHFELDRAHLREHMHKTRRKTNKMHFLSSPPDSIRQWYIFLFQSYLLREMTGAKITTIRSSRDYRSQPSPPAEHQTPIGPHHCIAHLSNQSPVVWSWKICISQNSEDPEETSLRDKDAHHCLTNLVPILGSQTTFDLACNTSLDHECAYMKNMQCFVTKGVATSLKV